jgi:SAM-dependent methyltransferase
MRDQRTYWDDVANVKTFTHPLPLPWLANLSPSARILDFGCGYGRIGLELSALGFADVVGVDFSPEMIARARIEAPHLQFDVAHSLPFACEAEAFDAVFLFAVLTCVPDEGQQDAIMGELRRVLRPGGLLFLSDVPLQSSPREIARYERDAGRLGTFGVFETSDGAVVRHQDENRWTEFLRGFDELERREVNVVTMNGSASRARQVLAAKFTV